MSLSEQFAAPDREISSYRLSGWARSYRSAPPSGGGEITAHDLAQSGAHFRYPVRRREESLQIQNCVIGSQARESVERHAIRRLRLVNCHYRNSAPSRRYRVRPSPLTLGEVGDRRWQVTSDDPRHLLPVQP